MHQYSLSIFTLKILIIVGIISHIKMKEATRLLLVTVPYQPSTRAMLISISKKWFYFPEFCYFSWVLWLIPILVLIPKYYSPFSELLRKNKNWKKKKKLSYWHIYQGYYLGLNFGLRCLFSQNCTKMDFWYSWWRI